jgi:hypothetical protein
VVTSSIDYIFGKHLLSRRVVAVSSSISVDAFYLVMIVVQSAEAPDFVQLNAATRGTGEMPINDYVIGIAYAILMRIAYASAPAVIIIAMCIASVVAGAVYHPLRYLPAVATCLTILYSCFTVFTHEVAFTQSFSQVTLAVITTSGVCMDCFGLVAVRLLLRKQASARTLARSVGYLLAQVLVGTASLYIPFIGSSMIYAWAPAPIGVLGWMFGLAVFTNLLTAILCASSFVAIGVLIGHRLFWPLVARPLYAVARAGIFRSYFTRTVLFAAGSAAITFGFTLGDHAWRVVLSFLRSA